MGVRYVGGAEVQTFIHLLARYNKDGAVAVCGAKPNDGNTQGIVKDPRRVTCEDCLNPPKAVFAGALHSGSGGAAA